MTDSTQRKPTVRRRIAIFLVILAVILAAAVGIEMKTSALQSRWLSKLATGLGSSVGPGPSDSIRFPGTGPYDLRLGYSELPERLEALRRNGFVIDSQARLTPGALDLVDRGFAPIYREKDQAGFRLYDRRGELMFDGSHPSRIWPSFDSNPPLLWRTLLFVEDRALLDSPGPRHNPAVNWGRLFRAAVDLGARTLGRDGNVAGASTLATQIEKFRHAPEGRTQSPRDKLEQMAAASIRAYLDGPETTEARRQVVVAYLNSAPFAGIPGFGEVIGFGDAFWAWFGLDFAEVNRLLWEASEPGAMIDSARHGPAYRVALQLVMAVQRPSYFLTNPAGQEALYRRAERYLELLAQEGVISPTIRDAARARVEPRVRAPETPSPSFIERKAVNAARSEMLALTKMSTFYQLDRVDASADATFDAKAQAEITRILTGLSDPVFIAANGLAGSRLLARGDPSKVRYAFLLYERTPAGNVVRVQADNFDAPFSPIEGAKLELGSTAKLRTLVSYLEIVERLYRELTSDSIRADSLPGRDPLSLWVRRVLAERPKITLVEILEAAMDRPYSASPRERFFTGGGVHTFGNFESVHDNQTMPVRAAFRHSVNLVFIRMMRDIVEFYTGRLPGHPADVLGDRNDPRRIDYLRRFADREGQVFLDRFLRRHTWKTRDEAWKTLLENRVLTPARQAWAFRSLAPDGTREEFAALLASQGLGVSAARAAELFDRADPTGVSLVDRGYLAGIHPLELWLVEFRLRHPDATRAMVVDSSRDVRQEVYRWLFATRHTAAQDQRIRSILEIEAFFEIHRSWQRLGYPFASLVPSYATAIGSSADRPDQLAELVGILVNGGLRRSSFRIGGIRFAEGTPYETVLTRQATSERVLSEELTAVVRDAMIDVVQNGTGRRASGAVKVNGVALPIGAKTGTGNNRYRVVGRGGALVENRAINRTSTVVFFIGDRFFGTITAFVDGPEADNYDFTSSLPAQLLQLMGPALSAIAAEPAEGV